MSIGKGRLPPAKSILFQYVLLASVLLASPAARAGTADGSASATAGLTLAEAVRIGTAQSPRLAALGAKSEALSSVPPQSGALPDPVLSLNVMSLPTDTFDFDQEPMTQLQIGLSQSLPFPGKRGLRREAAEFEARAARASLAEQRDRVVGAIRRAWWRLFALERALEIVDQNKSLMRGFVDIAEAKYAVGKGLQQDVLLAQLELSRLFDREARLEGHRRGAKAELNALLDRPQDRPVRLARTPENTRLPELPPESQLLALAAESRNLLDTHRERLEAAEKRLALARRDRYPDFRLGAGYGIRQGDDPLRGKSRPDFFSVMFSVNLPIYADSKQNKAIEQRSSEKSERKHELRDALRMVEADVGRSIADYESRREQVLLLESAIIPQAEQTVSSMLAGYQVNKVDFLNVVNGQLMLYNSQINYWEALAEAKRSLASLAAAVGSEALYE